MNRKFGSLLEQSRSGICALVEFADPEVETCFQRHRLRDSLREVRAALVLQTSGWIVGAGLLAGFGAEHLPTLALWLLAGIFPLNLLIYTGSLSSRYRVGVARWAWLANMVSVATVTHVVLLGMKFWALALGAQLIITLYGLLGLPLLMRDALRMALVNLLIQGAGLVRLGSWSELDATALSVSGSLVLLGTLLGLQLAARRNREERRRFVQELKIADQRATIEQERAKSDRLLEVILPPAIAHRLRENPGFHAERYDSVSILFADLSGFTVWAGGRDPAEVVEFLNRIFSRFDQLVAARGLERIKTIGDAYMVGSGLPTPRSDHARALVALALDLQEASAELQQSLGVPLPLRIGIHSGPVVAGVIGTTKFSFDLWGDAVNFASRLESHGQPGKIHLSEDTYRLVQGDFEFSEPRVIDIKSKGPIKTRFVLGRRVLKCVA